MRIRVFKHLLCNGDLYRVFYEKNIFSECATRRSPLKGLPNRDIRGSSMRRIILEGLQTKQIFRMFSMLRTASKEILLEIFDLRNLFFERPKKAF